VAEIEPHAIRRHEGTRLPDVRADHRPKRCVEEMGDRVIGAYQVSIHDIDRGANGISDPKLAAKHRPYMRRRGARSLRVLDPED